VLTRCEFCAQGAEREASSRPGLSPLAGPLVVSSSLEILRPDDALEAELSRASVPTGAGPGSDSSCGREREQRVESGLQGTGIAPDLREQQSALKSGEKRNGEVVGVDVGREMPGGVQCA
jgi:hypothetical protein